MLDFNSAQFLHEAKTGMDEKLISCNYISFGDYDYSCAVERANVRYLEQTHSDQIALTETGSYGYVKIWLYDTEENRKLLESLENYPCFDDESVSEIESEIEEEYLENSSSDLIKLLSNEVQSACDKLFIDFDRNLYEQAKELSNTYFIVESGGNGYIDFERLAKDYQMLLCEKHPAIKELVAIQTQLNSAPAFPIDFYESVADMLQHRKATKEIYSQDEIKDIFAYAVELEELINNLREV